MSAAYLHRYRNGEFLQYAKDILHLLTEHDMDTLLLTTQHDNLVLKVNAIDAVFKESKASKITPELVKLDYQRDEALTGIFSIIRGYKHHYTASKSKIAKALLRNIEVHGRSIQRLSYQEKTAVLTSIIDDWEVKPELAAAVSALNISEWLLHLKTVNKNFTNRYVARVEEQVGNSSENIKKLRREATKAYRVLIEHITAHITFNTSPEHNLLADQISQLAEQYNQVVENRTKTLEKDAPVADPTT